MSQQQELAQWDEVETWHDEGASALVDRAVGSHLPTATGEDSLNYLVQEGITYSVLSDLHASGYRITKENR